MMNSEASAGADGQSIYESTRKLLRAEAEKAAENIFGLAANSTGGYGNSWGANAAAGVYEDFAGKLAEKHEENALAEKKARSESLIKAYETAADLEDRQFEREKYRDEEEEKKMQAEEEKRRYLEERDYERKTAGEKTAYERRVSEEQTAYERQMEKEERTLSFALTAAENGDYSFLEKLGADVSNAVRQQALSFAVTAAENGDYSYLEALGVDTSGRQAEMYAKYGDYSGLAALGIDVSALEKEDLTALAEIYAKYGDYRLLKLLGVNTSAKESDDAAARRLTAARYYSLMN